jgi:hypothetical protein
MANVTAQFSATVIDEAGIKANANAHLLIADTSTVAQLDTALNAWISALDLITGGQIIRSDASVRPALPGGIKSSPVVGSEVQEVATFDFTQTGLIYHYGNVVPSFLETAETADHKPDLANTDVMAYYTLLLGAVLGGTYTGPGNDALAALSYAFLATRKHRKQERAVSLTRP